MGAFARKSDIVLSGLPEWDEGESITIKGRVTAGDVETFGAVGAQPSPVKMLEAMIVDWNLFGDNNQLVPFHLVNGQKNTRAIADLPVAYMTPAMEKIGTIIEGQTMTEQEQKDFLPSASEPTTAS